MTGRQEGHQFRYNTPPPAPSVNQFRSRHGLVNLVGMMEITRRISERVDRGVSLTLVELESGLGLLRVAFPNQIFHPPPPRKCGYTLPPPPISVVRTGSKTRFFGARTVQDVALAIEWTTDDGVLVSPVLAGLAVGIGVPILLFYVYGVVPVSLCRSGGCGVSTSSAGVRFDFDDENDLLGVLGTRNTDAVSMDAVSHRGGNPSIGEVSLSLGSGSQLERLGRENDRESASNVALAGASIAGSITSSLVPGGQRLEVQADVASTQRFSMSSETASAATSLSEKSVSVSMADDRGASTRALAGSVLNFKVDCSSAEVHADCASQRSDDAGGPVSLSSLEELASVGHSRRSRRRTPFERQASDSSSWTAGGEDGGSERVRFDDHVSFIETSSGRWRGQSPCDLGPQREYLALDDDIENKSTSSLRSVFFHSSTAEGGKRLPKIRKSGGTADGNVSSTDVEQQSSARQTPTLPVIPEPSSDHSVKIEIPSEDN
uniref:(California timema) hypothetical protein n=1 Tax=Timema californicum TaxID=61474 RepID=A0A7R9J914_TIMCA|nr:unnamed protein product [Timema californicum]